MVITFVLAGIGLFYVLIALSLPLLLKKHTFKKQEYLFFRKLFWSIAAIFSIAFVLTYVAERVI